MLASVGRRGEQDTSPCHASVSDNINAAQPNVPTAAHTPVHPKFTQAKPETADPVAAPGKNRPVKSPFTRPLPPDVED